MASPYQTVGEVLEAIQSVTEFLPGEEPLNVNSVGIFGSHPLKVAVTWGDITAVNLLIAAGAELNAKNEDGDTALHHAIRMGHFHVARRLVELGANQAILNNEGKLARDYCWQEEWPSLGLASA